MRDIASDRGELIEDTRDWYAQDVCGNIWYLGESTKEYEDGQVVSSEGSWQAGVDGAEAGVALPGAPVDDLTYRQEYLAGEAEDAATGDQPWRPSEGALPALRRRARYQGLHTAAASSPRVQVLRARSGAGRGDRSLRRLGPCCADTLLSRIMR